MERPISWYFKRSRDIIHEEGLVAFIKKAQKYASVRTRFDRYITRLLSRFYVKGFHKLYYYSIIESAPESTRYLGVPIVKNPLDCWVYQEIIYETKPKVIIETGTAQGGSALFLASICDLVGGEVITIDIENCNIPTHPRITKITGDSVSEKTVNKVEEIVKGRKGMVILDSCHEKEHVLKEMELYSKFVSVGNYLVVEDTNINGHPVLPGWGEGPMEAVKEFIRNRDDFEVDRNIEKFLLTFHPKGFLKRVKPNRGDKK
ncbi:MAG: CmcI family methyltransferase [Methanosarcinales archaeon Met12]|nr:MAG: CmcI family methyltransferase [Methanosarcinales archaeon Met12]